jgi:hypothetical protein
MVMAGLVSVEVTPVMDERHDREDQLAGAGIGERGDWLGDLRIEGTDAGRAREARQKGLS